MRTAPALLRKSRPWRDYFDQEQPLRRAIEKLVGRLLIEYPNGA